MAEDRKPKIDLKSRLQKMGGPTVATPSPQASGSIAPPSRVGVSVGPVVGPPSSIPVPGVARTVSGRPAAIDPAHPLAAVAQPFAPPPAAQPQRIEIDEDAAKQARRGGFKGGLSAGIVIALVLAALGYVGGTASTQGSARAQGIRDAHDLAADILKARESLVQVSQKLQAGGKTLSVDRTFPSGLAQGLSGLNVDFGGDKLFGRRFSGVPADTTRDLFDFITRVQALNDKKGLVVSLLNKLQKPITEELSRPAGMLPISYVAVVDSNDPRNTAAFLAPLATPISPDDKNGVPNDMTFANPRGSGNVKLPRLESDRVPKDGTAIPIVPNTFEKVCPSATRGQIAQLVSSMNSLIDDVQGQKSETSDVITESKPGLDEMAAKLADQLSKVN
jgi:hypothetical protein